MTNLTHLSVNRAMTSTLLIFHCHVDIKAQNDLPKLHDADLREIFSVWNSTWKSGLIHYEFGDFVVTLKINRLM
jgi:hypothetical protein